MRKLIHCSAGELVIWHSRSINFNPPATVSKAKTGQLDLIRIVAYVSMSPTNVVSARYTLDEFLLQREQEGGK